MTLNMTAKQTRVAQAELAALDSLGGGAPLDTRRLAEHDAANAAATRRVFGYRPRRSEAANPTQVRCQCASLSQILRGSDGSAAGTVPGRSGHIWLRLYVNVSEGHGMGQDATRTHTAAFNSSSASRYSLCVLCEHTCPAVATAEAWYVVGRRVRKSRFSGNRT
jgi:hypothetical protein